MSKWQYQTLFKEISLRGWRTKEPFPINHESSQIWFKVFNYLRQENMGIGSLAEELLVPEIELVNLVFGLVTVGLPEKRNITSSNKPSPTLRLVK